MIGYDEESNAISQYLNNQWTACPLLLENQVSETPLVDGYIKLSTQEVIGKNLALGSKAYRYRGILFIQIFTKPGTGTGLANEWATALSNLFRDTLVAGTIRFKVPQVNKVGVIDNWYQTNFSVEFNREEYVS